ncbi:MAG: hypothetical protein ACREMB_11735 [Candidatus Rokuibacteriota bacterium]
MALIRRILHGTLVAVIVLTLAVPMPAWSAASLGTVRGVRGVEVSLDTGKTWLALGSRSLAVLDGAQLRTTTGGAVLDLTDGSRVNVLPFSSLRVREAPGALEVSLTYGRIGFRLPASSRVEIHTTAARLQPVPSDAMAGEVFVGIDGTLGLRMVEGALRVEERASKRTMLASLEPVFVPRRPDIPGPAFTSSEPIEPPAGARALFSPKGESVGYLHRTDFVVHPGFTADLTQPFSPRLVLVAAARIPEKDRSDAMPIFDVNGGYVGYLAGPIFHAQVAGAGGVQVAQGAIGGGGGGNTLSTETQTFLGGGVALGFAAFGTGMALRDNDRDCPDGSAATPVRPSGC